MKRITFGAILLFILASFLVGCSSYKPVKESMANAGTKELMPGVHDDGFSSVIIIPARTGDDHAAIAEVINKKRDWEKQFPNKKIIAMTFVSGDTGNYVYVAGLLIHYETVAKAQ